MEGPCYVISSNGMRESAGYVDGWCYGPSEHLGYGDDPRDIIKADIRKHWERNGIPCYFVSDHGNESRIRSIRLRNPVAR